MLSHLAYKIRAQITQFSGKLSVGLSKPMSGFVEQTLYGLSSSQSVMLSEISRALNENIRLIKTENRLCRNLGNPFLDLNLQRTLAKHQSPFIKDDTLLIIDLSDISKKYAKHMEHLAHVRDGSEGRIANGYWTCQVVGHHSDALVPLYGHLYSSKAPEFRSENNEIFKAIEMVSYSTHRRGIWVMDRGGDRSQLFDYFIRGDLKFIVRLTQQRHLLVGKKSERKSDIPSLAKSCTLPYTQTFIRQKGDESRAIELRYGARDVRLPEYPDKVLKMVVVEGFGEKPLMLLTNTDQKPWIVVQNYLARWKVEETIRFMKQTYDLENIRLLTYKRLQNMFALVMAAVAFNLSHLSLKIKLKVMFTKVVTAGKSLFSTPDFHYYLLAQGMRNIFNRHPKPRRELMESKPDPQMSLL